VITHQQARTAGSPSPLRSGSQRRSTTTPADGLTTRAPTVRARNHRAVDADRVARGVFGIHADGIATIARSDGAYALTYALK
jgi:hypothetical protein